MKTVINSNEAKNTENTHTHTHKTSKTNQNEKQEGILFENTTSILNNILKIKSHEWRLLGSDIYMQNTVYWHNLSVA